MSDQPSLADLLVEQGQLLVDHFNDDHPDCVDVVARAHGRADAVHGARLVEVTTTGVIVSYAPAADADPTVAEVPFRAALEQLDDLWARAIEMIGDARATLGITELTSFEAELAVTNAIPTRIAEVLGVRQLSEHFVEITIGGGDLDPLPADAYAGFDVFAYVLLPPPGADELTIDNTFTWEAFNAMPPEERPVGAYYTVRRWRPAAGNAPAQLDMIFAIHDVPDPADGGVDGGHAVRWAQRARPGDQVALWGPRRSDEPPAGTEWMLLVADETGLPQVSVLLERTPATLPLHVLVETDDTDLAWVPERPGTTITWCRRNGAPAGTTDALVEAVRALQLPDGQGFAWGGAESRAMTAVRKHLRTERAMTRQQVSMVAYWRHQHSPIDVGE